MKIQTAWNKRKAFTLIELVVVVAVIGTLTAATIPTFNGITSTQNLKRSVDNLSADIQLAKNKALAGTTQDGNRDVFWGIRCFSDTNDYQIGYALDNNGTPGDFVPVDSKKIEGNSKFLTDSCTEPIYFERLTGTLFNGENSSFKMEAGGETTSIAIQRAGRVGSLKEFCGNGVIDDGEACDPEIGDNQLSSFNKYVGDCAHIPYGETCNYCTSDTCQKETVEGPHCGDGIKQNNEDCDIEENGEMPNVSSDYCSTLGDGETCNYCTSDCTVETITIQYCGNGVIDDGEACDPNGSVEENPANQQITACRGSTGYGETCSYCTTDNCQVQTYEGPHCGDGIVTASNEDCDPGIDDADFSSYNSPYSKCSSVGYGETCNYCTSDTCQSETVEGPRCGDGIKQDNEACDSSDPNSLPATCTAPYGSSCDYCDANCDVQTNSGGFCGDGVVNGNEPCDPSAQHSLPNSCTPPYGSSCDYCDSDCNIQTNEGGYCGDGIITQSAEVCDPAIGTGYNVPDCVALPGGYCYYCSSDCTRLMYRRGVSVCNYNNYCDRDLGETFSNCPDCRFDIYLCNHNGVCESKYGESPIGCSDCRRLLF